MGWDVRMLWKIWVCDVLDSSILVMMGIAIIMELFFREDFCFTLLCGVSRLIITTIKEGEDEVSRLLQREREGEGGFDGIWCGFFAFP